MQVHTSSTMTPARTLLAALLLALALGCAGSQGRKGEVANADGTIILRGTISERGSRPGSLIVLEATDGRSYIIQASAVGEELRRLAGMRVEIEAVRLPQLSEEDEIVVAARWYDLLQLPSGERPIVGYVGMTQGSVWVRDRSEVIWVIVGSFEEVFRTFVGYKVWVTGVTQQSLDTSQFSSRTILVTEYGVLRP